MFGSCKMQLNMKRLAEVNLLDQEVINKLQLNFEFNYDLCICLFRHVL